MSYDFGNIKASAEAADQTDEAYNALTEVYNALKEKDANVSILVNGHSYKLFPFTLSDRNFALVYGQRLAKGLSFLGDEEYQRIAKMFFKRITYNGMEVSKLERHFEMESECCEDYVPLFFLCINLTTHSFGLGRS